MNPKLVAAVRRTFRGLGFSVERLNPELPEIWSNDAAFLAILREIEPNTLVTPDRCFSIYQWARWASGVPGDFAEVGVYRGGTARLLARAVPGRTLHLFDTFEGIPHADADIDRHRAGDFSDTSLEAVRAFVGDSPAVHFHPGLFPASARGAEDLRFAFVHVDVDVYESVRDCLEFFEARLVPGGVMLFDDFDWLHTPGVRRAITEFAEPRGIVPVISARYQCALVKR